MSNQVTATLEARDLEAIDRVIYEPRREELVARSILNINTDIHPGAETYGYNVLTRSGAAKIIAHGSDDLPLVDTDLKRYFQPIYTIAAGIRYGLNELRQAQMTGQPVDSTKAATARRAIAEKENSLVWVGDSAVGIKGVAQADGIQVVNSDKKWKEMTSEEIIEQLRLARSNITVLPGYDASQMVLLLPPVQFEELTRRYSDFDSRTLRKVINENEWFTDIKRVADMKGVGSDKTDSLIIMDVSPSTCEILLPMDVVRLQEEWKYPNWKIPFEERCGGAITRAPYAVVRVDGI